MKTQKPEPVYLHHRLILDAQGRRLAKRHDALALATLRAEGRSAQEVLAMIADAGMAGERE